MRSRTREQAHRERVNDKTPLKRTLLPIEGAPDSTSRGVDIYKPLERDHIRVLTQPEVVTVDYEDVKGEVLSIRLVTHSFDSLEGLAREKLNGGYVSLSYRWNREPTRPVICNDAIVWIGSNLHDALWNILDGEDVCVMWADALCINQQDLVERGEQVMLMGQIYREARFVAIWLGEHDDHVSELFKFFKRMDMLPMRHTQVVWEGQFEYAITPENNLSSTQPKHFISAEHLERLLRGWKTIGNASWFHRAWTLQEVAQNMMAIIYSGTDSIRWDTFAVQWGRFSRGHPKRFGFTTRTSDEIENIQLARQICGHPRRFDLLPQESVEISSMRATATKTSDETNPDLLGLLISVCKRDAEDARDKVFSVLGMLPASTRLSHLNVVYERLPQVKRSPGWLTGSYDRKSAKLKRPGYRPALAKTYVEAAQECIAQRQDLNILLYASRYSQLSHRDFRLDDHFGLPSWAPNWGVPFREPRGRYVAKDHQTPRIPMEEISGAFVLNYGFQARSLCVRGLAIGYTASCLPFPNCVRSSDEPVVDRSSVETQNITPKLANAGVICQRLSMHEQQLCACEDSQATDTPSVEDDYVPKKWMCILFGASQVLMLRPEYKGEHRSDDEEVPASGDHSKPMYNDADATEEISQDPRSDVQAFRLCRDIWYDRHEDDRVPEHWDILEKVRSTFGKFSDGNKDIDTLWAEPLGPMYYIDFVIN